MIFACCVDVEGCTGCCIGSDGYTKGGVVVHGFRTVGVEFFEIGFTSSTLFVDSAFVRSLLLMEVVAESALVMLQSYCVCL